MANQNAIQDDNQVFALTGHSGTAGTAEVIRVVVNPDGSFNTSVASGSINIIDSGGTVIDTFGADPVGLKNAASTTINPATEETLDELNAEVARLGEIINSLKNDSGYVHVTAPENLGVDADIANMGELNSSMIEVALQANIDQAISSRIT